MSGPNNHRQPIALPEHVAQQMQAQQDAQQIAHKNLVSIAMNLLPQFAAGEVATRERYQSEDHDPEAPEKSLPSRRQAACKEAMEYALEFAKMVGIVPPDTAFTFNQNGAS